MRAAGENAIKAFQDWAVGIDYREDVYKAIKAFADHPKLSGRDEKLLNETLRDYRRAGLDLPPDQRKEVEQLRKELSKLGTDFDTNIVKADAPVIFTKADLNGLPEVFCFTRHQNRRRRLHSDGKCDVAIQYRRGKR